MKKMYNSIIFRVWYVLWSKVEYGVECGWNIWLVNIWGLNKVR